MKVGWLAVAAASATLLLGAASAQTAPGGFFVGFSEDLPRAYGERAVTPARELDAKSFRLTLQWAPGQTRVADSDIVDYQDAVRDTSGLRVVLAVYNFGSTNAANTASRREEYCSYVRDALTRLPSIRDVVIWNEPNKSLFWSPQLAGSGVDAAPVAYEALLARCYDVLHGAIPDVNVIGLALSPTGNDDAGSHSPGGFIRAVGAAYRASGRTRPLFDTVAHHAYGFTASERPWRKHIGSKILSQGDWNKLMYNLWLAFNGTAQAIPAVGGVGIWYMEGGSQTAVDPAKASAYTGTENVAVIPDYVGGEPDTPAPSETSAAPDQYTQVRDSIRLAACQPYVGAYFNFLLMDEPRLAGWQSGAYWADLTPKDSLPAFREAIAAANAGTIDCNVLKGGRPSPDFMPPSAPTDLSATPAENPLRVDLTWTASTDDMSALGYRVYRNGAHVGTTSATSWTNTAVAPTTTYTYTVRGLDAAGNLGGASTAVTVTTPPPNTAVADFDGDGDTDVSVWRPSNGVWYVRDGLIQQWGDPADVPVPGQYDADPATDVAVWRPSNGVWYVHGGPFQQWGDPADVPVPGDYDGDGDTEFAVWRPSNRVWYVQGDFAGYPWGQEGDIPVPGDYDGDGDSDFAVWRPSSGVWYVQGDFGGYQWGQEGDIPVPGDYNAGPGAEFAVFRPSTGHWYIEGEWGGIQWGQAGDVPVLGDYNGDGDTDFAVWRPSNGVWYVHQGPFQQWGDSSDKPLPPLPSVARVLFP